MSKEYYEGVAACDDGRSEHYNPYRNRGTATQYQQWQAGYRSAQLSKRQSVSVSRSSDDDDFVTPLATMAILSSSSDDSCRRSSYDSYDSGSSYSSSYDSSDSSSSSCSFGD